MQGAQRWSDGLSTPDCIRRDVKWWIRKCRQPDWPPLEGHDGTQRASHPAIDMGALNARDLKTAMVRLGLGEPASHGRALNYPEDQIVQATRIG
jgi:hypothetical protein